VRLWGFIKFDPTGSVSQNPVCFAILMTDLEAGHILHFPRHLDLAHSVIAQS
jgi:hypothetical protein